jgi:soluble lytic murein transglycosylase
VNFTNRSLFQPAINLKIGTTVLRSMLDQNSGSLEQTLASYNAGPNRLAEWLTWRTYREPAEFVESIPFTETREYVQAVLRNADIYRRLYR